MQIFYFRKKTLRWLVTIVVVIILAIILWRIFGLNTQQAKSTLIVAQIDRMIN
ncbi:MAG: hypothetical protein GX375_06385 [Clostridiales bacterium]|nr:hypothetical protein [Clostridiales bacterium]